LAQYNQFPQFYTQPPSFVLDPFFWGVLIAIYLIGRGLGLWGRLYRKAPSTPYERFDSAVLARYVDVTLKSVLLAFQIDEREIETLQFAEASWIEERRKKDEPE